MAVSQLRPGRELSEAVGLIQQQFDLVPQLPVVQNVLAGRLGQWGLFRSLASLFSPRERGLALEALSRLGIDDKIDQRTGQLSGGEQQRVAIARALAAETQVEAGIQTQYRMPQSSLLQTLGNGPVKIR